MEQNNAPDKPATLRDLQNLEATMLAAFEVCYEMLGTLMANHATGKVLTGIKLDEVIKASRQNFQRLIAEKRAEYFSRSD